MSHRKQEWASYRDTNHPQAEQRLPTAYRLYHHIMGSKMSYQESDVNYRLQQTDSQVHTPEVLKLLCSKRVVRHIYYQHVILRNQRKSGEEKKSYHQRTRFFFMIIKYPRIMQWLTLNVISNVLNSCTTDIRKEGLQKPSF